MVQKWLIFKELLKRRPIPMLSSIIWLGWAFAMWERSLVGSYIFFEYLPWPWRALWCLFLALGWPLTTILVNEGRARDILGIQGMFWIYTGAHYVINTDYITLFFVYTTLGLFVLYERFKTPKVV